MSGHGNHNVSSLGASVRQNDGFCAISVDGGSVESVDDLFDFTQVLLNHDDFFLFAYERLREVIPHLARTDNDYIHLTNPIRYDRDEAFCSIHSRTDRFYVEVVVD